MQNEKILSPYNSIKNIDYHQELKIIVKKESFADVDFQEGKAVFYFEQCWFKKVIIENDDNIDFKDISICFFDCCIEDISVDDIETLNISIGIFNSVFSGRFRAKNIKDIRVNNCLLIAQTTFFDQNIVRISFTEEDVSFERWKNLFNKIQSSLEQIAENKQSYSVHNTKEFTFTINENSREKVGIIRDRYSPNLRYKLSDEQKKKLRISLDIEYSPNIEHIQTLIGNSKLSALSMRGFASGKIMVENSQIDNLYFRNFSASTETNFYNIRPYRANSEKKFEIHESNLSEVWLDNISFDDYTSISFYRTKLWQTKFTSCDFPENTDGFEKFLTIENIHYRDIKDNNYYKTRYEIFLQLKKCLEISGNFYEADKLRTVSLDALYQIERLSIWDKFILLINKLSNNHGLSIKQPLLWILGISILLYILYLLSIGRIFNCNEIDYGLIGYFFAFQDITHRSDFLVGKEMLNGWSFFLDYLNKILLGFLIYQFIVALRKYGKK